MKRQAAAVHERAKQADIVITTALIPGRKAPTLLHENTVLEMKPGSVIVDLAVEQGGNCPLSVLNQVVTTPNGVKVVGYPNLATHVAADASSLYARNIIDFLKLVFDKEGNFTVSMEDDIVAATLMCMGGELKRKT
jgi:NAD(P) transhydrogenase subunit alpha